MQDHTPEIIPITSRQIKDLTGQVFGRLTVLGYVGTNNLNRAVWLCRCECGTRKTVASIVLLNGSTLSCGCLHNEITSRISRTHGLRKTTEYSIWANIKTRCHNPNSPSYEDYGARGITMCDEWRNSFEAFLADMGTRPDQGFTIDRINNDLGYSPDNCHWATYIEQANNKRGNHILEFQGEKLTISQWARKLNIPSKILRERVNKLDWPIEKALMTPVKHR